MAARTWALITATTTAALLLTACGGSGGDDKPDAVNGAATGSPSATASASASASSGVERPTITLPSSFKLTHTKNRRTGKVEGNPAGTNPYVSYVVSPAMSTEGVWQNSSVHAERGACSK